MVLHELIESPVDGLEQIQFFSLLEILSFVQKSEVFERNFKHYGFYIIILGIYRNLKEL